jgi:hypothetical protein
VSLINAHHQVQECLIGCSGLQYEHYLNHHTTDSVLISECSFISQHISIKISMVRALLIMIKTFCTGESCMPKLISGRHTDDLRRLSSGSVPSSGWSGGMHLCRRLWSLLSASDLGRCTCAVLSPECLQILPVSILAMIAP